MGGKFSFVFTTYKQEEMRSGFSSSRSYQTYYQTYQENTFQKKSSRNNESRVYMIRTNDAWESRWRFHKESNKLVVIYFSAATSESCRLIESAFASLSASFTDVVFIKMDIDEVKDAAQMWKINATPTFVFVKGGIELDRVVGTDEDLLKTMLMELRN